MDAEVLKLVEVVLRGVVLLLAATVAVVLLPDIVVCARADVVDADVEPRRSSSSIAVLNMAVALLI